MAKEKVFLSEAKVNDFSLEFDFLVSHNETRAQNFKNWMKRNGYPYDEVNEKYYYYEQK